MVVPPPFQCIPGCGLWRLWGVVMCAVGSGGSTAEGLLQRQCTHRFVTAGGWSHIPLPLTPLPLGLGRVLGSGVEWWGPALPCRTNHESAPPRLTTIATPPPPPSLRLPLAPLTVRAMWRQNVPGAGARLLV